MKILICTSEYPPTVGGFANVAYNLEQAWKKKGHEVTVVYPKKDIRNGRDILKFWDNEGWPKVIAGYSMFDIIWCQNPMFSKVVPDYVIDKVVCTTHTTYNGRWEHMPDAKWPREIFRNIYHRWMVKNEKDAFKQMKNLKFITTSRLTQQELKKLGIKKSIVIHNGVDTEEFKPNGEKKEQLCAVSRLVPWKRVDKTIEIANELGCKLKIAGDGPLLNKLKKMAKPNVTFLGKINKEEVIKLYQESKGFISSSEYEGMPLALLEAMACGCVPLVSDIPGHTEITKQIEDEEDPQKIHKFMKENYDWSKVADKYLEAFK